MNFKAIRTVLGGVLIHISLGSIYTAANMITYIISYIPVVVGNTVPIFCCSLFLEYNKQHVGLVVCY